MKINGELRKLLIRTLLFVGLFILVSGIIGPYVISTKLLYGFNFFIYGNLGKLVIFSVIVFLLLTRDRLHTLKVQKVSLYNYLFILFGFLLLPLFFYLSKLLLLEKSFTTNTLLSLSTHVVLILIPLFLLCGVFGISFLTQFYKDFKRELLICLGISVVLFFSIFQVWKLWPFLSVFVLQAEYLLFSHIYPNVYILPPYGLFVHSFIVQIAEACSGLESIFLFTVLYILVSVIDWKKLHIKKVILFFPLLLIGLVLVNILRVFLLIMVGVLINPQIMSELFHTYLGLVLFIIYFFLFLKYGYPHLFKLRQN